MSGEERREHIKTELEQSEKAISATTLADHYTVSRQVIVQDIAILRAAGCDIISTHRGYVLSRVLPEKEMCQRIYKVKHTDEETLDELYSIVDLGGRVKDVFINHKVYGQVRGELNINSRKNADDLIYKIKSGKSSHLKNITSGYHYHTVLADNKEILDDIGEMLKKKKYLIETKK